MDISNVEAFWDAQPCNLRHSPKPVGSRGYFEDVSARRYFVEPHIEGFAEFDRWRGKKVLEIGCGIGTDAARFAEAGADYTGVDTSAESLRIARQRFSVFGLEGAFYHGDVESLHTFLPRWNYDLVYAFGVLHHTPDPYKAIGEIREFMGVTSELRLMLYADHSWKRMMIDAGLDQPEAQAGCPIARTYTHSDARDLLSMFKVRIHQDHIFPYEISAYHEHRYRLQRWFQHMPKPMFDILKRELGWHLLIKATL